MKTSKKEQKNEIALFIENSVNTLLNTNYTCCKYDLDCNLAIFVGWSAGYEENDPTCFADVDGYAINVGIKIRNDFYWADYDGLNFVIFNDDSGEVFCQSGLTINRDENYEHITKYLLKCYSFIKAGLKNKTLTL